MKRMWKATDAEPGSGLAAGVMGMDVEDDAADGGMIVDDDGASNNNIGTLRIPSNLTQS